MTGIQAMIRPAYEDAQSDAFLAGAIRSAAVSGDLRSEVGTRNSRERLQSQGSRIMKSNGKDTRPTG